MGLTLDSLNTFPKLTEFSKLRVQAVLKKEGSKQPKSNQLKASRNQCLGRILGIIGQGPSVSEPNRLHVDIFRHFFAKLRYIL